MSRYPSLVQMDIPERQSGQKNEIKYKAKLCMDYRLHLSEILKALGAGKSLWRIKVIWGTKAKCAIVHRLGG